MHKILIHSKVKWRSKKSVMFIDLRTNKLIMEIGTLKHQNDATRMKKNQMENSNFCAFSNEIRRR